MSGRPTRLLDLRSGWPLLVSAALCVAVAAMWASRLGQRQPVVGDGHDVTSYGFDLSNCLVPRDRLVAGGFPKDGLPALVDPAIFTRSEAEEYSRARRRAHQGKFLVASDRVIGVVCDGEARAYPLSILNWHEVANDTLGGRPVLVTYNPLCDSAIVFDRQMDGQAIEFGVSGLLYNSNLLMYDRQHDPNAESLWSQLLARAVSGPAAGRGDRLTILPAVLVHWSDWAAAYPDTTVVAPQPDRARLYKRTYAPYFGSDLLRYPVASLPPSGRALKTPMVAVQTPGGWHEFALPDIAAQAGAAGTWYTTIDGVAVEFSYRDPPPAVWPRRLDGEPLPAVYAFWFAWYAMRR